MSQGGTYEVVMPFEDAHGDPHPAGERWSLLGTGFNKFEDMMWLGVRTTDGAEWLLPLDWNKGRQDDVLERWDHYVRPAV